MGDADPRTAIEAVWRIESARLIAGLARMTRDVGVAEDLAQDALVAALEQWPASGVPDNPGAWLMTAAKRRAIDGMRRSKMLDRKHGEIGWELEPSRAQFLPDSVAYWMPFREANAAMDRLSKRYEIGIISNIDDKLLGVSRRHLRTELNLVVTAQQVRSYKPDPAHFKEAARRIGGKKGWVHIASSYYHDVEPCLKEKVPVIWVNRHKEALDSGQKKPTEEVKTLLEASKLFKL